MGRGEETNDEIKRARVVLLAMAAFTPSAFFYKW